MTVSQRASEIYEYSKGSGGTWGEAMAQARMEVFNGEEEAKQAERDAQMYIQKTVEAIRDQNTGSFWMGQSLNNMLADIINAVVDRQYDKGAQYPYWMAKRELDKNAALDEIESLVYSYTKADAWDGDYRDIDGRISNSWWTEAQNLMENLNLESDEVVGYEKAASYFV